MAKIKQFEAVTKLFVAYKKLGVTLYKLTSVKPVNTAACETAEKYKQFCGIGSQ